MSAKHVKLGYSVHAELRKVKGCSELEILKFRNECKLMLKTICLKLLEKSPLKYKLCKAISFCDPTFLARSSSSCLKRLELALKLFLENNWLSGKECDMIEKQFKSLIEKEGFNKLLKEYKRENQRIDHFWRDVLIDNSASNELQIFMKKILILSHGNAFVERGFSINKEIEIENQINRSIVAQRRVYNAVQAAGGLDRVEINKKMIIMTRNSYQEYSKALKEQKRLNRDKENEKFEKEKLLNEVKELKIKKMQIMTDRLQDISEIDEKINTLLSKMH